MRDTRGHLTESGEIFPKLHVVLEFDNFREIRQETDRALGRSVRIRDG